ncbi:thiamine-phosphate kinase [Nocardia terpenica]|nr:thiamine-phosphate kinase [Nocardia terpenica]MBF6063823.1 thiamine-phosphate kinase [Nocardia terpenica]MBF6108525.1 thiamine-phosphate kinase [Nocardia terpenica]MBF6116071.1 thiamine-phosphate kinase [Nocardia terpenica]MBF6121004.1 thiamine-phosphate kinase [Nocardia terpenica]MBF6156724.1 thiamine-phosphate kinase [Nocardia terpenica]
MADTRPRTVRELGEFGLIARMTAGRTQAAGVLLGPGDDAAVLAAPAGRFVVSTDMLLQDRHFRLDWSTPYDIGGKVIAQNAADVVAMGSAPSGFVVSLGCPADTPVEFVDGFVDGMWAEARRAGGSIAGGDVVRSPLLVISVTAFGDPLDREPVLLSGARPGDVVAVAGRLGASAAGLAVLAAGIDPGRFPEVVAAHRLPQPPYEAVLGLPPTVPIHALTDVSDGLLADVGHIAESSGVAVDLDSAAIADPALRPVAELLGADALAWGLTGGEDHAFAATFPVGQDLPAGWVAVGRVAAGSGVTVDGAVWTGPVGWESFTEGG